MTVWAEEPGRFMDESRFRTISAREFARRFRSGVVLEEIVFLWFLGAGCSASSGVPTAAECVRRWLKSSYSLWHSRLCYMWIGGHLLLIW